MRTLAGLCLACALTACTFEPSRLTGGPGPSPSGDAAVPDAPAVLDAAPDDAIDTAPDAAAVDAGPLPPLCEPADPAVVGCFAFENTTDDASGSALAVSAVNVGFDEGRRGRAAVFTADSVLRLPETEDLDIAAVTVEMWVRPDALPVSPARAGLFDNDGQYSVFLFGDATVRCLANGEVEAAGVLAVGIWTHVACVHDGQDLSVYIDGQIRDTGPAGSLNRGMFNGSNIGGDSPLGVDHFIGRIDELRVWSRARTPAELCEAAGCTASRAAAPLRPR